MRYGSVCSGIEAATAAWHPLGWEPAFFSEIEKFPRAVLAHHYPQVPLHGDFTTIGADEYGPIDLLIGGTPCQSFSIAGLRGGLADDRGNLALEFLRLAQRTRAKWLVWENVSGVLSSNGGRDFGAILGGLVELGYGFAYRVLDAQHFGVPQRRRRVFVVGHLGDWRRAAAVLFERHSLQGHPAPRREKGEGTPGFTAGSFGGYREGVGSLRAQGGDYGGGSETLIADTLTATYGEQSGQDMMANGLLQLAHSLRGEGFDASEDGTGRGTPLVPVAYGMAVDTTGHQGDKVVGEGDVWPCLAAQNANNGGGGGAIAHLSSAIRRLTPRECERLQGFPDDYTLIPWRGKPAAECPDGPRYKALGNSMAVPVMRWIGQRIAAVEALPFVNFPVSEYPAHSRPFHSRAGNWPSRGLPPCRSLGGSFHTCP